MKNPSGTRDFFSSDLKKRNYVIDTIKSCFELAGFEPLETPAIENIETLLSKYGEEGSQLLFKILKRNAETAECDLGLRYDLTVPFARIVTTYRNKLSKFYRRYSIQPVWRADRPAKGRFREFYQCDIDIIGSASNTTEIDLINTAYAALTNLGFSEFNFRLNDRRILKALMLYLSLVEQEGVVYTVVDKLDKIGLEGVKKELEKKEIPEEKIAALILIIENFNKINDPIEYLQKLNLLLVEYDSSISEYTNNLKDIIINSGLNNITVDLTLVRGLTYYTSTIFEIVSPKFSGSLGGGGRYDNLIESFGGPSTPACGFSLGLERIFMLMEENNLFPEFDPKQKVMIAFFEETQKESIELLKALRRENIISVLYPQKDKISKQFEYANANSFDFVALIGVEEKNLNKIKIKNMRSGEQILISYSELATFKVNIVQ